MDQQSVAIGVDVGGSSIKTATVDLRTGKFAVARASVATPAQGSIEDMLDAIAKVIGDSDPKIALGIAFPSVIRNGTVFTAANINKAWIGKPLTALAETRLRRPVVSINDADAAGLAEIHFGAGRDVKGTVLVLTLGTGIGSALFLDSRLVTNTELGHLEVKGREAEHRASGRVRVEQKMSWDQWTAELNLVLQALQSLLWPDLIILCGGITDDSASFFDKLECKAPLRIGALRADAGIVGAAMATATQR
jgi:polyphosphate glucokinase